MYFVVTGLEVGEKAKEHPLNVYAFLPKGPVQEVECLLHLVNPQHEKKGLACKSFQRWQVNKHGFSLDRENDFIRARRQIHCSLMNKFIPLWH